MICNRNFVGKVRLALKIDLAEAHYHLTTHPNFSLSWYYPRVEMLFSRNLPIPSIISISSLHSWNNFSQVSSEPQYDHIIADTIFLFKNTKLLYHVIHIRFFSRWITHICWMCLNKLLVKQKMCFSNSYFHSQFCYLKFDIHCLFFKLSIEFGGSFIFL